MTQQPWRKAGVFNGIINPFPTSQPTHTCTKCGHLTLYSTESTGKTTAHCPHCQSHTTSNLVTFKISHNLHTNNEQNTPNNKPHMLKIDPTRKIPNYNKNLPNAPPQKQQIQTKSKPQPSTNTCRRKLQKAATLQHLQQRPQKHNNDSKQRKEKWTKLMQKQFNPNYYHNKPLPPSNHQQKPQLMKHDSDGNIKVGKSTQRQNFAVYYNASAISAPDIRKIQSTQMTGKLDQNVYNKNERIPSRNPKMKRAQSDSQKRYQHRRMHCFNRYPHRGPPIDFATLLQQM